MIGGSMAITKIRSLVLRSLVLCLACVYCACTAQTGETAVGADSTDVPRDAAAEALTEPVVAPTLEEQESPRGEPAAASERDDSLIAIVNGTVIDGSGAEPISDGVVLIEDGSIVAVGLADEIEIPVAATVIDAAGGTVLPGLIDTHTHNLQNLDPEDLAIDGAATKTYLTGPLRRGLTTFRDAGSSYGAARDLRALHAALAARGPSIPTVTLTGPILTVEGNGAFRFGDQAISVAAEGGAGATVELLANAGVDQIKVMVDDWSAIGAATPTLSPAMIEAVTVAAHERGLTVVAHAPTIEFARQALEAGADELTHWPGSEPLPDDLIAMIVSNEVPVGTTFGIIRPAEGDVRRILDAGGMVVLSTDAPGVMSSSTTHLELGRMVEHGMTPMEAIVASTAHAAVALELDDRIGTLAPGMVADVLVVDGDPLRSISDIASVLAVVKSGVIVVPDQS